MRTYSAAGTKLSERSVEFVRMDGEGNRPPLDQRRLAHSIQPSDALLRDGDGAGVSAQTSGSSSMLSASVDRHGSADMAVFMYSYGVEVSVRADSYKLPKETCINSIRRT